LLIDIRIDALQNILHLSESSNRNFLILEASGNVVYASDESSIGEDMHLNQDNQHLLGLLDSDEGNFYANRNQTNSVFNHVASPYSGWRVIQYIDKEEMTKQAEKLRQIILILVLSSFTTAALFMLILNRRVTKPIIDLSNQVHEVGKGKLHIRLNSDRQDEFGILYQGVNKMAHDLEEYVERSSVLKAQQK